MDMSDSIRERGDGSYITPPFHCEHGGNIRLGSGCYSNKDCYLGDRARIDIGDRVLFGPRVRLHTQHQATDRPEPICIEDDCWLCAGVIVGPGVRIGRGSVIAAGCVITRDVAPHSLMRGNPAQLVRTLRPSDD